MKICVISSTVFPVNPPYGTLGYAGLEVIAWECARGLASRGHEVSLIAPDGSSCPGVTMIPSGPAGRVGEDRAYGGFPAMKERRGDEEVEVRPAHPGYWQELPNFDVIVDHSVAGSERLLVRIDGRPRWLSFEELYEWAASTNLVIVDRKTCEVPVKGLEALSVVGLHEVAWRKVSSVTRHLRREEIHKIKTTTGHCVQVTAGHSLIVAGTGGLDIARADACLGKHLVLARHIPPASSYDKKYWEFNRDLLDGVLANWRLKHDVEPRWPILLSDEDLILFGLWIGDGCYDGDSSVVMASGQETKWVADKVAEEFDANCKPGWERPDVHHRINSKLLVAAMKALGFVGDSHSKKIPDWIFGLSRRQIGLFLSGYFSADGCVSGRVVVCSVSEELIRQTVVLLAICGVRSAVFRVDSKSGWSGERYIGWELDVLYDDALVFESTVGFVQKSKAKKLKELVHKTSSRLSWRGDVPYSLVRERRQRSDCAKLERTISLSRLDREKGSVVARRFASSDLSWRRILKSEPTGREDRYVYDLSVPGSENFLVGLACCHNTWGKFSMLLKGEGRLKTPILGVMHAPVNTMLSSLPPGVEKPCIVCISQDQTNHFNALFSPAQARTCYNGVDLNYYKPLDIPRSNRFLFLARFSTIKGADLALQACLEANASLDLIGDTTITGEPDYLEKCKALAAQGKPGQLRIIGGVPRGQCVWWYSQAYCLLHPNQRFREPFGLAPVEAQLCGCPVIAWRYGAMPETVKDGETGWLVNSMAGLVDIVSRAGSPPPVTKQGQMRQGCRNWACKFSLENMVSRYEELCKEALDTGGW